MQIPRRPEESRTAVEKVQVAKSKLYPMRELEGFEVQTLEDIGSKLVNE